MLKGIWSTVLAQARQEHNDQFSEYTWSVAQQWLEVWDDLQHYRPSDTDTLMHVDAHPKQMFFPTDAQPRFVLFDWQNPGKGWGATDAGRLLVTGLSTQRRREQEAALRGQDAEPFPSIRFHDLRHTAATLMLLEGIHPKVVQERLGHATISMTLDTYSHVLPTMQADAAERLGRVLSIA